MSIKSQSSIFTWVSGVLGGLMLVVLSQGVTVAQNLVVETNYQPLNFFQAVFLGFVQGMTEFLPISSSAHLKVVPMALGWGDPGVAFTAIIQLGSILAVISYFWQDLKTLTLGMVKAWHTKNYDTHEFKIGLGIIVGTIPICVVGLSIKAFVADYDSSVVRGLSAIALTSIIMSILLAMAEKFSHPKRNFDDLSIRDGILMGLAQTLALIPGVSRSGSTITAGLFINLERSTAARFSFLLGIPAITIAGLVELRDVLTVNVNAESIMPLVVGTISSAIFSYLAIAWLIRFLQKKKTWIFVWYRLLFGLIILGVIFFN
ncbi:undecaprenyl-diphosphate phosphatase [Cyanobacterium stanieri LEGE 03274]|uniref:Undecaprenyl-diphosphatase n=1 Tax=Cyanobacterium stanieri LEGE 03274 TaxID=1828756 RepID=A0ABR9V6N9_9CHRO|nr:undecaprenyl-diphosphate phosphatase [Cyanobacterium stanieri]MBE9222514.1 undecaprenyl-diphosphate phosphatase [Cyanobacterium stanieri LEGE 03274]